MKAAILYETNQRMEIKDLVQDPPKAGEVRVKMRAAGVCASDRHVMTGASLLPLPVVLGHEAAGIVEEVGEGVARVKPGDRCILSFVSNCGHAAPAALDSPTFARRTSRPAQGRTTAPYACTTVTWTCTKWVSLEHSRSPS